MADQIKRKDGYYDSLYSWNQVRDCVKGSAHVKRQNELYLPMPSGFRDVQNDISGSSQTGGRQTRISTAPWYHENPAYRSFLQRARFPDITGSILRGMTGIITKIDPEYKLSNRISKFEQLATVCNKSLIEAYTYSINEVMQTGKMCYVLDVTQSNEVKIALYSAERNVDWEYTVINGERVLSSCVFIEQYESDNNEEKSIKYFIANDIPVYQRYIGNKEDGLEVPITFMGKAPKRLPIFFSGSTSNTPEADIIPLLGVSDIALTIYRKDSDLSNAEHMTCNPTLFIYGISEDQTPKVIGSTVAVTISNPEAKAEYPPTDTSALDHCLNTIQKLFDEAVSTGAQILGVGKKNAESAEALSIREASSGATMITIVDLVSKTYDDILKFASEWSGSAGSEFQASVNFADNSLTPQKLTALVASWVNGAISHDTLLDKLRDANVVDQDTTNLQEKARIKLEEEEKFVDSKEPIVENKDEIV